VGMKVKVRLWGIFQELAGGGRELSVDMPERATVGNLIGQLISRHGKRFEEGLFEPGTKEVKPYIKLLLNGNGTTLKAKLRDGDVVAIFPPVGGG